MGLTGFVRRQSLLVVSGILAVVSLVIVPPSMDTLGSIDVKTLCILFCFMLVIAGIASCGTFMTLADRILNGRMGTRTLCVLLVMLPTLCSMLITNDVALITFVPFSIIVLLKAGRRDLMIPVIVLQTVGANLGSSMTPFGNPQNLFIFSHYSPDILSFMMTVAPLVAVGAVVLVLLTMRYGREVVHVDGGRHAIERPWMLAILTVLFVLSIVTVLGWVPYQLTLVVTVVAVLVIRPRTLLHVDYGLLLTFVFLFVFTGNLTRVEAVNDLLDGLMCWDPLVSSALVSQVTSNVPAAVMLSNYTMDWQALLAGVNIGGFGTPIASMASVISLRLYSEIEGSETGRYLVWFTVVNVTFLVLLLSVGKAVL